MLTLPALIGCVLVGIWFARLAHVSSGPSASVPTTLAVSVTAPSLGTAVVAAPEVEVSTGSTATGPAPAPDPAPLPASTAAGPQVSQAWLARTSPAAGISTVAMSAYAHAVLTEPTGCDLGWTTLAGIGWVESQQGTIDGRTLATDGYSSSPILGPAIPSAGSAPDHALGPLQFLASTWTTWGRDGDGDGIADPQDLDDASVAATAYLCGTGEDLGSAAGWAAAVFAYNHSDAYVRQVYDAASTYAARTG